MSKTIFPCRRICCGRKAKTRLTNKSNSNFQEEKISNNSSQLIQSDRNIISTYNQIDLDRLTKEYLETINEYRFHLGFSSLELSNELTNRALNRAFELSIQNYVENTNRFDLIYNNEPIGET